MKPLDTTERFLERLYEDRITKDYDAIIPVVGDEGVGKSTWILQAIWMYQQIRGVGPSPESVLDTIVWEGRDAFKRAMSRRPEEAVICSMDAARVLYKRDAMKGDQESIQKDLLDLRMKNNVIFLGYQDWDIIPTFLQERRAKHLFFIPDRGLIRGYNRSSLDQKVKSGDWPSADMKDKFPDLEGTELWTEFRQRDLEKKRARINADTDPDIDEARQEQIKTALRATKPWDEDDGMSYRDAARLIDFSRGWISDRVDEWKHGEHRDLIDTPTEQTA